MKNDKILSGLVALTVAMLCFLPVLALTPYWIYSPPSTTQVGAYALTLVVPAKIDVGQEIELATHLEYQYDNGTIIPIANAEITFYIEQGGWNELGTAFTDPSGNALFYYTISQTSTFRAGYYVTSSP